MATDEKPRRIHFYGSSDDLIEVEGAFDEEYNGEDETFVVCGCLRVRVFYDKGGCWSISVGLLDEEIEELPQLDITRRPDTPYSMELIVHLLKKDGKTFPATVIREATGDDD